ncbi:hypothetical protein F5Y13DRAFT_53386 [Hypoxylon sp. FL1857]|nr:hypothetical protein F5Y13DRAFT_53386 [Hypoxylon sp. FL1857]
MACHTTIELGKFGKTSIRNLDDTHQEYFNQTKQLLYDIVSKTPLLSYREPSPAVVFNAFLLVNEKGQHTPTVLIGCTSRSYAKLLRRQIQNSGVLTRGNIKFQVVIGDNERDYHIPEPRGPDTGNGSSREQGTISPKDGRAGIFLSGLSLAAIRRYLKTQGGGTRQSSLPV